MAHVREDRERLQSRIRRIAGQLSAVEAALGNDAPCTKVLQQLAAARGALNGLMDEVIASHLRAHVAHPDLTAEDRAAGAKELLAVIKRYAK